MEQPISRGEDIYTVGVGCCVGDQIAPLHSLRRIEYAGVEPNPAVSKQPVRKARLAPTMPSSIKLGPKYLKAKFTKSVDKCKPQCVGDQCSPRSVAHKHFANGPDPELLTMPSLLDDSCNANSLVDAEDDCQDADTTACSETRCPTPSPEDLLALEVGQNAHEYLEECFYTEAAVLSRAKFNAIPQIDRSDFTVMTHLGKGNFSDVFHVVCQGSGGHVDFAMKSLRSQLRDDDDQFTIGAEDIVHETAILANLNHRHIIKLHGRASGHLTEAFVNEGYFILLDKLKETLHGRFVTWKQNMYHLQGPTTKQLEVAHSIADAMSYLHSRNIVFRDLKPDNVGFDHNGDVKLFDFGFAIGLPEKDESNPAGFLYDRCGTPRYMAPEVGFSLGYGRKADVYSFGVLLWEMCALTKPFANITSASEFEKLVFMGGSRPPINNGWSKSVKDIIKSCWSATPSKRPNMSNVNSSLSFVTFSNPRPKRKS
mmetsp:Transcript_48697/g.103553  ORF Transcript_48697/g.103553 Transcript_48697/m.103553 type:complete len:482 (+) Transcript_48697:132-1577(+)